MPNTKIPIFILSHGIMLMDIIINKCKLTNNWHNQSVMLATLTYCDLVTPYPDIYLDQHWLKCSLTAPSHYPNQCWLKTGLLKVIRIRVRNFIRNITLNQREAPAKYLRIFESNKEVWCFLYHNVDHGRFMFVNLGRSSLSIFVVLAYQC